jgi:hypothetical protein
VGGVRERDDLLTVYHGEDCAIQFLDTIQSMVARNAGKEILYYSADQKRSSEEAIRKFIAIKEAGVKSRYLLRNNDTHIMEDLSQYRWMPDKLWMDSDAKIIFSDIVAYAVTWQAQPKIISLKDQRIADAERKVFEFVWEISAKPTYSTAEIRY